MTISKVLWKIWADTGTAPHEFMALGLGEASFDVSVMMRAEAK